MKQILKLVFLLVLGQTALAQAPSNYTNINGRYRWIAGMFDSTFHIPKGTTPSLRTGGSTNAGGLFYNTGDSSVYTYTGTQWIKVRGSLNPSDTTNKYVTQVYKKNASDSVFYVKGGNHLFAFIDSVGSPGGGGGGKVYYFNGGVSMGTFGGFTMYELGDTANTGAAANFTRSTTGNIANFITDPGKPGLLQIPAGVWSVDAWLSESGGGANHAEIWVEVEKWNGSTITTIATSPIEQITEGGTPNLYSWSVTIPTTSLTITDRIIIQFYISNTNGKTVTLYTQNGYVGEVHTTFTTGIGAINGLTAPAQYLVTGTSGTDFNINSATATHTFNLPTASATNRGALSSTDWSTFNNKQSAITLTTTGTSGAATLVGATLNIPQYQSALTNPVTGTGVNNQAAFFTGTNTIAGSSVLVLDGSNIAIGQAAAAQKLSVNGDVSITTINNATTDTDKFLVSDGGVVKYRTGSEVLSDIGAASSTSISGTTNYIPKFTSSSAIGNSQLFDSGSSVGIATSTPNQKLTIQDGSYPILGFTIGSTAQGYIGSLAGAGIAINSQIAQPIIFYTNDTERMRITSAGNVGIGLTNPASYNNSANRLVVGGTADAGITIVGDPSEGTSNLYLADGTTGDQAYRGFLSYAHSNDALAIGTSGTTKMTLNSSGNLGLGVTPSAWYTAYGIKAIQFAASGSVYGLDVSSSDRRAGLMNNAFINSSGNYEYINTGHSTQYEQSAGTHKWLTAVSGTAGNAISFTQAMTLDASGRLGIGTTSPAGKLHIAATTGTASPGSIALAIRDAANSAYGFDFNLEGVATGDMSLMRTEAGTQYQVMTFKRSNGNVGIGTTSPSTILHAVSNDQSTARIRIQNTGSGGGSYDLMAGNPNVDQTGFCISEGNTVRMRITSGGNVGIGTSSPAAKLQVSGGSIRLDDGQALEFGGSTNFILGDNTNNLFRFYTNNSEKMRLTSAGELLINTTSDAGDYKLQVNGNVYATAYFESSDLRLKNVLSKNKGNDGINTITFKWKDGRDNLTHIGYVAQEVEKVLPDAVKTNPDGYKTVNYDEVQTLKIANLEQEVKELKALIKKLMDKK